MSNLETIPRYAPVYFTNSAKPPVPDYLTLMPDMQSAFVKKYSAPREGIHVRDVLYCHREQIFRLKTPKPITGSEISNFSRGEGMGAALQHLSTYHPGKYTIEKEMEFMPGHVAHIDLYNESNRFPIEVKTYAAKEMTAAKAHYIDQLSFYMAITGSNWGLIYVQLFMQFDYFPFAEFPVYLDDDALSAKRAELIALMDSFKKAKDTLDPSIAKTVIGNPKFTDKRGNWKCRGCKYKIECGEIEDAGKVAALTERNKYCIHCKVITPQKKELGEWFCSKCKECVPLL